MKQHFINISASFADLGLILPLLLGMTIATGMNTGHVLMGLGVFAIASGWMYRRPIPAQPMKVVAAMAIVGQLDQQAVIATGILMGLIILILGITGWAGLLKKLVSSAVLLGIQTTLAVKLILTAVPLVNNTAIIALVLLGLFTLMKNSRAHPVAFITILTISLLIFWQAPASISDTPALALSLPVLHLPSADALITALNQALFPQLALTLTNALFLTAAIAHEYYPSDKLNISENKLALSTGGLNLLLTPFGAVPMCHGAGGLVAYHTAGGRSGLPVIVLGSLLLTLGLFTGSSAAYYLAFLPAATFGLLLLITATYMVDLKKLTKTSLVSRLTVLVVVCVSVFYSILAGLVAGIVFEYLLLKVYKEKPAVPP